MPRTTQDDQLADLAAILHRSLDSSLRLSELPDSRWDDDDYETHRTLCEVSETCRAAMARLGVQP